MDTRRPVVATGQQIGAGWTPALSVVKALAALAEARRLNIEAVYWLADEDHDRAEVASVVGFQGDRLVKHRFRFDAPEDTAAGWLPWTDTQQQEAEKLWGTPVPAPIKPDLRNHIATLGKPLWRRGIRPFSPTDPPARLPILEELERWRSLGLERDLAMQAERMEAQGETLVLDPRKQKTWFSLDPQSGLRRGLEPGEACPEGHWLSPGALLRPLMQSLMLPVKAVVLGPAERDYWRLLEPLWERVGLTPPRIVPRPSVFVIPTGLNLNPSQMDALRLGYWESFLAETPSLPSRSLSNLVPNPAWGPALGLRFKQELIITRKRLARLDRRACRDAAATLLGRDPERLRQELFPFDKPMERVIPGLFWLRNENLLDRILEAMDGFRTIILLEAV